MSAVELRKRLIDKIQNTDNTNLLAEAYRLLEIGTVDLEVYKFTNEQKQAIKESKKHIENGQFLTNAQADNEIDEWLNK
jgi:hypothetical protein